MSILKRLVRGLSLVRVMSVDNWPLGSLRIRLSPVRVNHVGRDGVDGWVVRSSSGWSVRLVVVMVLLLGVNAVVWGTRMMVVVMWRRYGRSNDCAHAL